MSMKINHELPLPEVLKSQYPLSQELKKVKKQSTGKPIPCFMSLFFCYFFSISDPLRINFVSTRLVCFRTLFLPSSIDRTLISNNSSAAQPIS